ncbi:PLP-dependent aspartate aminotransferase family protein [Chitinibacter sp. ZOR0017]|uniref:trans-sulfuration enzyme family protein n=1 Tax=Chitinibacter sp. ZOR0017 TaxID=1339254 RepID=UPI0006464301|nr:aminotransferase class I/II-fold pyridoxal phosphate-dependent enzyme [Chitinibacter sp. ZOR0017]
MYIATQLARAGLQTDTHSGSISTPIYQTATFAHPALGQSTGFDYSRSGNPTRQALEHTIAELEGGSHGFAFASGLAALSTVLALFSAGDHLVVSAGCYGGTYRLLDQVFARFGLQISYVPLHDAAAFAAAIQPNTKAILLESLSNPCLDAPDFAAISALAQQQQLRLIVDNTLLSPLWFQPLCHGADIVLHSASKSLSGHNDTIAGVVAVRDAALAAELGYLQNAIGATLGPQDAWLVVRGIKTLALRLAQQERNALALAQWLAEQPQVSQLRYPGLAGDPAHRAITQFASGFGVLISFSLPDEAAVRRLIERLQWISFAESLGGVESLITVPALQTHANLSPAERQTLGVGDHLVRLSVGIEDTRDLRADLAQALA